MTPATLYRNRDATTEACPACGVKVTTPLPRAVCPVCRASWIPRADELTHGEAELIEMLEDGGTPDDFEAAVDAAGGELEVVYGAVRVRAETVR